MKKIADKFTIDNNYERDLEILKNDNKISVSAFNKAKSNIKKYESKGFFAKYYPIGIFVILSFLLLVKSEDYYEVGHNKEMEKPISKSKCYEALLIGGFLGFHFLCLRKFRWLVILTSLLTIVVFMLNYKLICCFYNIPEIIFVKGLEQLDLPSLSWFYYSIMVLGALYIFNYLYGIVFIPYMVYRFNSGYFRNHYDNDKILSGKELSVDIFWESQLVPDVKTVEEDLENVKYILDNSDIVESMPEDEKLSGFFKSIFTLGNSGELKYKVQRLRALQNCCNKLLQDFNMLHSDYVKLSCYLRNYRIAAYRNLYLAKELISIIKTNVKGQNQTLMGDTFVDIRIPEQEVPTDISMDSKSVEFNSDVFFDKVTKNFSNAVNDVFSEGKEYSTKEEFFAASVVSGGVALLKTAGNAISGIMDMNLRTKECLRDVEIELSKAIDFLDEVIPNIYKKISVMNRQAEIMVSLSKANKAFIRYYVPLRNTVFGRPNIIQFIMGVKKDNEIFNSEKFRKDLHLMCTICSEYNKINKAKSEIDIKKSASQCRISNNTLSKPLTEENIVPILSEAIGIKSLNKGVSINYILGVRNMNRNELFNIINSTFSIEIPLQEFNSFITVKDVVSIILKIQNK